MLDFSNDQQGNAKNHLIHSKVMNIYSSCLNRSPEVWQNKLVDKGIKRRKPNNQSTKQPNERQNPWNIRAMNVICVCGYAYGDPDYPHATDDWLSWSACHSWYHETCGEDIVIIFLSRQNCTSCTTIPAVFSRGAKLQYYFIAVLFILTFTTFPCLLILMWT